MRTKKVPLENWEPGSVLTWSIKNVALGDYPTLSDDWLERYFEQCIVCAKDALARSQWSDVTIGIRRVGTNGNILVQITSAHAAPASDSTEALALQLAADATAGLLMRSGQVPCQVQEAFTIGIRLQENFRLLDLKTGGIIALADSSAHVKKQSSEARRRRAKREQPEQKTKDDVIIVAAEHCGWIPGTKAQRGLTSAVCKRLKRTANDSNQKTVRRAIERRNSQKK